MTDTAPAPARRLPWTALPATKLGLLLILLVLLQIPLFLVGSLIDERQSRQNEVLMGIRRSWGPGQAVIAPNTRDPLSLDGAGDRDRPRAAPSGLGASAGAHRGDHGVARARRRGSAACSTPPSTPPRSRSTPASRVPQIVIPDVADPQILWQEAILAIGASDMRGQPGDSAMTVDGQRIPGGAAAARGGAAGIAAVPARLTGPPTPGTAITVQASLALRGTQSFYVVPWGQQIDMKVTAPWQTPSFNGVALPLSYDTDPAGFRATWQITGDAVANGYSLGGVPLPGCGRVDEDGQAGVDLLEAVPDLPDGHPHCEIRHAVLGAVVPHLLPDRAGDRPAHPPGAVWPAGAVDQPVRAAAGGGGGATGLHRRVRRGHGRG